MTEHNIFQEIEEDLQRAKLEALWKRYGNLVIAGAAVVVLGTALVTSWKSWRADREQKATAALVAVLNGGETDAARRIAALENFAHEKKDTTQAAFAALHAGALAARTGDTAKAVKIYDGVASASGIDPAFRQLADLLSVQAQMDGGDPAALEKRLQPLLADNAPWRGSAMETMGYLALKAGDTAKARQMFGGLAQDASAPQSLKARVADMLRYLGE